MNVNVADPGLVARSRKRVRATRTFFNGVGPRLSQGMLKIITDGSGNVTTDGYDAVRRLTSTTFPEGAVERYTYRADGLLETKTDRKDQVEG